MHMNFPMQLWGNVGVFYVMVVAVASFILHLFLAIGVYTEASFRSAQGRKLWFIGPFLWAFATFVGGIVTAALYWAMHHSTLTPIEENEE